MIGRLKVAFVVSGCCLLLLAFPALCGLAKDTEGQINPDIVVPALIQKLKNTSGIARESAARTLESIGSPAAAAVPTLIETLKDKVPEVRSSAARALGRIGSPAAAAVPALTEALKDKHPDVRASAADSLGRIGSSATSPVPALIEALKDKERGVRFYAAVALGQIAPSFQIQASRMTDIELSIAIQNLETGQTLLAAVLNEKSTDNEQPTKKELINKALTSVDGTLAVLKLEQQKRTTNLSTASQIRYLVIGLASLLVVGWISTGLLLWWRPLALLSINEGLQQGPLASLKLVGGYLLGLGFFHYHARVLDAWVNEYVATARKNLRQRPTFAEHRIYVDIPIRFPDKEKRPAPSDFHDLFAQNHAVLLLWGEGGSGKTTLACQMALWAMGDEAAQRLCEAHRMLPVFIEESLPGAQPGHSEFLLAEIRGRLQRLIGADKAPTDDLVKNLLYRRRILLIVDGYSELDTATQQSIRPNDPALPLNALLVTSRTEERLNNVPKLALQTGLSKGAAIAAFLEVYLKQADKRQLFTDEEFNAGIQHLLTLVGDREITPLIARLYADYLIENREGSEAKRTHTVSETLTDLKQFALFAAERPALRPRALAAIQEIALGDLEHIVTSQEMALAEPQANALQASELPSMESEADSAPPIGGDTPGDTPAEQTEEQTNVLPFMERAVEKLQWAVNAPIALPEEFRLALAHLDRAAKHVGQYYALFNAFRKREALERAIQEVEGLQATLFGINGRFAALLLQAANGWRTILEREHTAQQAQIEAVREIPNPFVFGNAIPETEQRVFQGRQDIVQQIESSILGALHTPVLLLYGPRRMGKTSILNQLPRLLGNDFAPATVDCQNPAMRESKATLLRYLSRTLSTGLQRRRVMVEPLTAEALAQEPFAVFADWLDGVEQTMPPNLRALLCLDEYERLQAVLDAGWGADVLDMLRNTLQHRPRIVLMFTGAHTFAELGPAWTDRFISARRVRVSFLSPDNVRQLLTQPIPEFDMTYDPGALEAILHETNCQPFLTQAVAFELVDYMNQQKRKQATCDDVEAAIKAALEKGGEYFANVWSDTGLEGQAILRAIVRGETPPDYPQALNWLHNHDVLTQANVFAVPMVERWVRQNA